MQQGSRQQQEQRQQAGRTAAMPRHQGPVTCAPHHHLAEGSHSDGDGDEGRSRKIRKARGGVKARAKAARAAAKSQNGGA